MKQDDPLKSSESPLGEAVSRRDIIRLAAGAAATLSIKPWRENSAVKWVPEDKGEVADLLKKGSPASYSGKDLRFIGMPVGGICAGTVYLGGDGKLWLWDVFNQIKLGNVPKQVTYRGSSLNPLGGANYVDPPTQTQHFEHGVAIRIQGPTGDRIRTMDSAGWESVKFSGEYPIGKVSYHEKGFPVEVELEAFSPFIPLDPENSALPVVLLNFTLKNTSRQAVKVDIGGWMENPVGLFSAHPGAASRVNKGTKDGFICLMKSVEDEGGPAPRAPITFEDWSKDTFEGWKVEGTAFGSGPALKTATNASGGPGLKLAKSYFVASNESNVNGDSRTGKLTSRPFKIERRFIEFWINGGRHPGKACLNLIVDGKVVRSETGQTSEELKQQIFEVSEFEGKEAVLEILDSETGFWGQVGVGQITFVDRPAMNLEHAGDFGEIGMAFIGSGSKTRVRHALSPSGTFESLFHMGGSDSPTRDKTPRRPRSGTFQTLELEPGKSKTVTLAYAWRFPNLSLSRIGAVGNHYAVRYPSLEAVFERLRKDGASLMKETRTWHKAWYDSTLPRWFLDRTMAPASTLATMTCVRFGNGRFYGWEGIGCCDGTCGHVWQYAHLVGRLFPSLERSVREMVDFAPGVAFNEETGVIDFRGEYGNGYAADAQAGYVLRTYREHQMSADSAFLKRVYPRMKKALQMLIREDKDANGILEGRQHNTLDVDLYGPSSWLTSLYLAALRAGEEMASETGDTAFARECRGIFEKGSAKYVDLFWNGDYFIHRLKLDENLEAMRIGNGCEADQIMGQTWAHQVGLGDLFSRDHSRKGLQALFKNNFLPDVGPFRDKIKEGRWYAMPGEAGLLVCTFPKGDRTEILGPKPTWASMYFNECWTGCEYQAASVMMSLGLVEESMRIVRAAHDRHHPSRRNPYNEVECSDHYARGMASYGVFVAASGFTCHGPKKMMGFAPVVNPENFRGAFVGPEGWGTYQQMISGRSLTATLAPAKGKVSLKTLSLAAPPSENSNIRIAGPGAGGVKIERDGTKVVIHFDEERVIKAGEKLTVKIEGR